MKNPVPSNAATLDSARALYRNDCAKCHGVNGDGKKPPDSMYSYSTKPANFTDAKLVDAMSDGEIFWKITPGRKPMPSFKIRLTDKQRWELVNLIRVFAHPGSAPAKKNPSFFNTPFSSTEARPILCYFVFASASATSFMSGSCKIS